MSPQQKNSIYEVMNTPTIIGEFSIIYEMTTPSIFHDVTTLCCIYHYRFPSNR